MFPTSDPPLLLTVNITTYLYLFLTLLSHTNIPETSLTPPFNVTRQLTTLFCLFYVLEIILKYLNVKWPFFPGHDLRGIFSMVITYCAFFLSLQILPSLLILCTSGNRESYVRHSNKECGSYCKLQW